MHGHVHVYLDACTHKHMHIYTCICTHIHVCLPFECTNQCTDPKWVRWGCVDVATHQNTSCCTFCATFTWHTIRFRIAGIHKQPFPCPRHAHISQYDYKMNDESKDVVTIVAALDCEETKHRPCYCGIGCDWLPAVVTLNVIGCLLLWHWMGSVACCCDTGWDWLPVTDQHAAEYRALHEAGHCGQGSWCLERSACLLTGQCFILSQCCCLMHEVEGSLKYEHVISSSISEGVSWTEKFSELLKKNNFKLEYLKLKHFQSFKKFFF